MIENFNIVVKKVNEFGGDFAVVKNPVYVFPPEEFYPLAPSITKIKEINAVLMDMDGTTTTTELLCIYSLEQMIRRMSGLLKREEWGGIDHSSDLPYIIGNSTTRHVEYLVKKYEYILSDRHIAKSFLESAWWTLNFGQDANRRSEVLQNLKKIGLSLSMLKLPKTDFPIEILNMVTDNIDTSGFVTRVSLGVDIYYETYHRILSQLKNGKADQIKNEIMGQYGEFSHVVSPMPGISFAIPLLKGWLGEEASVFVNQIASEYEISSGKVFNKHNLSSLINQLKELGIRFEKQPVKLALVTSSIRYEADIVISEVLTIVSEFIKHSNLSTPRKQFILNNLKDPLQVYDAFVTATDSSEIRLKPHRDLYSIALHQLGVLPVDFDKVVGFEDSQSGTVALRAAGIGCCIAVPFAQTNTHNFSAASHVLYGGIPEAILDYNFFLNS